MKIALLAGTHSGCGKTTVMLALLQYLKNNDLNPGAFKVGPDFLDPFWHTVVTGKSSYNLDTQMIGIQESRYLLDTLTKTIDYCLIEGVMGMFDGRSGVGQAGSSVDLASQLNVPILLVVDAQGMSGSIAPLVSGFCRFAKAQNANIKGIIANRLGSQQHANLLAAALAEYQLPPLLGWLSNRAPVLPERHLGLKMPEHNEVPDFQAAFQVDSEALVSAFSAHKTENNKLETAPLLPGKTIAIARDEACCFIYPGNLKWLSEQGAKLEFFSPLAGESVPDADALWLPGGYPELHGRILANSASWQSIAAFVAADKPVLAECGGAMLLGKSLIDSEGHVWPMANILPFVSKMQNKLVALGYREEACGIRGHEFHYSTRESETDFAPAFTLLNGDQGIRHKNLRASYIHWYFASAPSSAANWFTA